MIGDEPKCLVVSTAVSKYGIVYLGFIIKADGGSAAEMYVLPKCSCNNKISGKTSKRLINVRVSFLFYILCKGRH